MDRKRMEWDTKPRHRYIFDSQFTCSFFHLTDLSIVFHWADLLCVCSCIIWDGNFKYVTRAKKTWCLHLWKIVCCMLILWHCVTITCSVKERDHFVHWKKNRPNKRQMIVRRNLYGSIWLSKISCNLKHYNNLLRIQIVRNHTHDLALSEQVCHQKELRNFSSGSKWILFEHLCVEINCIWCFVFIRFALFFCHLFYCYINSLGMQSIWCSSVVVARANYFMVALGISKKKIVTQTLSMLILSHDYDSWTNID